MLFESFYTFVYIGEDLNFFLYPMEFFYKKFLRVFLLSKYNILNNFEIPQVNKVNIEVCFDNKKSKHLGLLGFWFIFLFFNQLPKVLKINQGKKFRFLEKRYKIFISVKKKDYLLSIIFLNSLLLKNSFSNVKFSEFFFKSSKAFCFVSGLFYLDRLQSIYPFWSDFDSLIFKMSIYFFFKHGLFGDVFKTEAQALLFK